MDHSVTIRELVVIVAIHNHDLALVSPKVLTAAKVVPREWTMLSDAIVLPVFAQISYQEGVRITAEPDRITFLELLSDRGIGSANAPDLAKKYVDAYDNTNGRYVGISINPRGHVSFGADLEDSRKWMVENLLAQGSWMEQGQKPVGVEVRFFYELEDAECVLTVKRSSRTLGVPKAEPVVVFDATFYRDLSKSDAADAETEVRHTLDRWQRYVNRFEDLVNNHFLAGKEESQ